MVCAQCGSSVPDGSAVCPQCGTSLAAASSPTTPSPGATSGPASGPAGSTATFHFDAKRWVQTDQIVGGATLVLFISLFLPWFSVSASIFTVSVDGLWHGWMYLTLILCLAILAYLVMTAGFETMPFKLPMAHERLLLIGTGINFVLTLLAFVLKPGGYTSGVGWSYGAFVGLIAAVVAAAPLGYPAIKARRAG